jgi:hypothetical protein
MPLHVEIRVNDRVLETIHIGRLESLYSNTQESTYAVWKDDEELGSLDDVPLFKHRYDEGAEVCVMKALQALNDGYEFLEDE